MIISNVFAIKQTFMACALGEQRNMHDLTLGETSKKKVWKRQHCIVDHVMASHMYLPLFVMHSMETSLEGLRKHAYETGKEITRFGDSSRELNGAGRHPATSIIRNKEALVA
ncbi:hypothetical protein HNO89_004330 [Sporosarcina luteola]|nr:hypothetical protein [Sporosarcina luteola]